MGIEDCIHQGSKRRLTFLMNKISEKKKKTVRNEQLPSDNETAVRKEHYIIPVRKCTMTRSLCGLFATARPHVVKHTNSFIIKL